MSGGRRSLYPSSNSSYPDASVAVASGVDLRTVASRLGHSSPDVTMSVYAHLLRPAIAALQRPSTSSYAAPGRHPVETPRSEAVRKEVLHLLTRTADI
jgi:hypothetical protein